MKRIFLDTNILIDYIDNRAGADDAEQIFACGFSGEAQAKEARCDYIVTNDRHHFDFSNIPHLTSSAFVEQLDELIQ